MPAVRASLHALVGLFPLHSERWVTLGMPHDGDSNFRVIEDAKENQIREPLDEGSPNASPDDDPSFWHGGDLQNLALELDYEVIP